MPPESRCCPVAQLVCGGRCFVPFSFRKGFVMLQSQITVGGVYVAKVNGNLTRVRVESIRPRVMGPGNVYNVVNLKTGRSTAFRSAAKFRAVASSL